MWINFLVQAILLASLALSVNLLVGYAGQVSVAHAAFASIGGYTVAYMTTAHGWPFAAALVLAAVLAAAVGILIGLIALGLAEEFLILMTLAFSLAIVGIFATFDSLGGVMGLTNVSGLSLFGLQLEQPRDWIAPAVVTAVVVFAICWRLGESPYGRVLKGIREDSDATRSLGKNVFAYKVAVFAITAAMAGWIGAMYSGWLGLATPGAFGFTLAMSVFTMVIVGGSANLFGSVVAAVVLTMIEPTLRQTLGLESSQAVLVQVVLNGALLVLVMIIRPQGLFAERFRRVAPPEAVEIRERPQRMRVDIDLSSRDIVLRTDGLSKRFGGIQAANDISIELRAGTITALVGPNGAGKTTLFNLLTGAITPDAGSVRLDGRELVGLRPDEIAHAGVVRTFQDVRLLGSLTCLENVMLAVPDQPGERLRTLFVPGREVSRTDHAAAAEAMEWLGFVGMADHATTPCAALSYGQAKLVSAARVLATRAPVLLLDEPASGVDATWVETMMHLVDAVRAEGRTVCLVEHNLDVVRELADHTYFMELGQITASGTIAELTGSARLTEAYFGAQ